MKVQVKVGQCYITRKNLVGKTTPYVSIRSGTHRAKTRVAYGVEPNFEQILQLNSDKSLSVKVKDSGFESCFPGGCGGPINTTLGQVKINLERCYASMQTIQGFYPLKYKDQNAGKIFLTITPSKR